MATPNKFRKETELKLNGHTYACRPSLDKMGRIESRFGPALPLLRRVGAGEATQLELAQIVAVMLRGVPHAPREADIPELIFEEGSAGIGGSIVNFLVNGVTVDTPEKPEEENAEGDAGN
jgi:hypothetical protein